MTLGSLADMRCAECIDNPVVRFLMGDKRTDTNDRMVDVLGKLLAAGTVPDGDIEGVTRFRQTWFAGNHSIPSLLARSCYTRGMDITEFARRGGLARARKLTKKRRKEIAIKASMAALDKRRKKT